MENSRNSSDAHEFGQVIKEHLAQLQTTYGLTYLVADSALYSADNLQKFAETNLKWITRVPATLREAQQVLAQADPHNMAPLTEGYRYHVLPSRYGGIAQRWMVVYSEHRHVQAQHTIDKHLLKQGQQEIAAFQRLRRMTFACEADAQQALATFTQGLHATFLHDGAVRATPRYDTRGRPRQDALPAQSVYTIAGALASSLTARPPLVDQQSCFILATNELDETLLPPTELLASYKGQSHAERGFRFLKDPQFLASSLYLKKPERIMALLMIMTVCLLVYAALEYRIRTALKTHGATFRDQKGKATQTPIARWVFYSFVGIHVLFIPQQGLIVLNLTEEHQRLLQLLGARYIWFYR